MNFKTVTTYFVLSISFITFAQDSLSFSLEEALQYARENNFDKQIARLDMDKAEKKVKETIGIGLPQINGSGRYSNNLKLPVMVFQGETIPIGQKHNGTGALALNQLLFDGSYIVGVQSTKAFQKISELATLKTDEALTEAILQLYASIIVSNETLKIYKENLKVLDKNLHDVEEIYRVGLGEEQTVEQMTFNRNRMTNSIINTENIIKTLYQNLEYVMNLEEGKSLKLTTTFDDLVNQSTDLVDETQFNNLENHIDLRIAKNQTITDRLQLKYEKSKFLPSLSGFLSTEYNAFSDRFNLTSQKWYNTSMWGLSINVPIFSGLQRIARVQQSQYQLQKSELNELKIKRELQKKVNESFINFQNALLQLDIAQQQVALSESIFNKENIKFFEGLGTSLELTQAENQVFQAQAQLIQTVSEVVNQKITLDKALGKFNLTL